MRKSGHLCGSTRRAVQAHGGTQGTYKQESSDAAAGTAPALHASTAVPLPGSQVTSLLRVVWCPAGVLCAPSGWPRLRQGLWVGMGTTAPRWQTPCPSWGALSLLPFLLTYKPPELKVAEAHRKEHIGFDRLSFSPGAETWFNKFAYGEVLIRWALKLFQGHILRLYNKCLHTLSREKWKPILWNDYTNNLKRKRGKNSHNGNIWT